MTSLTALIAICVAAVVLFDAVASFASKYLGVPYVAASLGSFLIYGITGYFAGRLASPAHAAMAGAIVGLSESTIGWYVSWMIGPGRPTNSVVGQPQIAKAIVQVTFLGAVLAGATATVASTVQR